MTRIEYNNAYNKEHYRQVKFNVSFEKEKDILTKLDEQKSIASYIKGLIREDIQK